MCGESSVYMATSLQPTTRMTCPRRPEWHVTAEANKVERGLWQRRSCGVWLALFYLSRIHHGRLIHPQYVGRG